MNVEISYDKEFTDCIESLKSEYPEHFDIDGIGYQLDLNKFSAEFFNNDNTADVSIDSNANVGDSSIITYGIETKKPYEKLNSYYMLWKRLKELYGIGYANDIIKMQITGVIYIHDVHGVGAGKPYCFNYSAYDVYMDGLPMVSKIKSVPPKHLYSFKSQMEQFMTIAANSTLGATGVADLLIVMSYYIEQMYKTKSDAHFKFASDDDIRAYIKETLVSFIYTVNQPTRSGSQSIYTNVSIYDKNFLKDLQPMYLFRNGHTFNIKYVQLVQDIFLETMNEELARTPVTFPVTTACISIDENRDVRDEEFLQHIMEFNREYGFINFFAGKSSVISACCRLRSDMLVDEDIYGYTNSIGGSSTKVGSIGVCSLNLPHIAYKTGEFNAFKEHVLNLTLIAASINDVKRKCVQDKIDCGAHPLYTYNFINIKKQYSTLGINGLYEAMEIMGYDISNMTPKIIELMDAINKLHLQLDKQFGFHHNCEQVPGENMSVKMAIKDRISLLNNEYEMYSNQFIPLTSEADLFDRIMIQGQLDQHFSGGSVLHINLSQHVTDEKAMMLLKTSIKKGVIYQALNYVLNCCIKGHMSAGNYDTCPICNDVIVDKYTRVVGFLSNVKNWHKTRREIDFPNRKFEVIK